MGRSTTFMGCLLAGAVASPGSAAGGEPPPVDRFLLAINHDRAAGKLDALAEEGYDLTAVRSRSDDALGLAAQSGNAAAVDYVADAYVKNGLSLDHSRWSDGKFPERTPLEIATRRMSPRCVEILVTRGADPRVHSEDRGSVLYHMAIFNVHDGKPDAKTKEMIALLVDAGADLPTPDKDGLSAFDVAVQRGSLTFLRSLPKKVRDVAWKRAGSKARLLELARGGTSHYLERAGDPGFARRRLKAIEALIEENAADGG